MLQPPRYFATILYAILALCTFLIPLILAVYVGHAFFFGPRWLSVQAGHLQIMVECILALLGGAGLFIQLVVFWMIGFVMCAKASYEYRYTRYIRAGNDPHDWVRHALT